MWNILFLGSTNGFEAAREAVDGQAEVTHIEATPQAVADALPSADALLDASMRVRMTRDLLSESDRLRIIVCATTGSDHIDPLAVGERKIVLRTLRDTPDVTQGLTPAAELTWALVLACARHLVSAVAHVRAGNWVREQFPGVMLRGKTVGLVGCGRIGQWVAQYAKAFDMHVVGYDRYLESWPLTIETASLREVIEQSDVVSIHVPLTDETRGLIDAKLLGNIKPGAIFVNTSRGAIVDEAALLEGLESGRIAAAGLDVLNGEPDIGDHPLVRYARHHDNLVITPHCGGYSPDAVKVVCRHAAQEAVRYLEHSDS